MDKYPNANPNGKIAVIADKKHLFLVIDEFFQTLKDKIHANVTQPRPAVVKFETDFYEEPLVTVIDPDTVSYEENPYLHSDTYSMFRVDPRLFLFAAVKDEGIDNAAAVKDEGFDNAAAGTDKGFDNAVDYVSECAIRLLRIAAIDVAAGLKGWSGFDPINEQQQQQQQSSDQNPELSRKEAESIVNIINDFFKYYQEYYQKYQKYDQKYQKYDQKKGGGKKRSSSNILKTSSSRRGRRSSKKRATKRKPKRRQRRASRRAY
jgi:hypothetical protein